MAALSLTYALTNGTLEDAAQVQQNFVDIRNYINASTMRTDGTNAMTTALKTDNVDPTLNLHAVRKAYMDGAVAIAGTGTSQSFPSNTFVTLNFATEFRDADNGANTATNYNLGSGVFTTPKTGLYAINVGFFHSSLSDGTLYTSQVSILGSQSVNVAGPSTIPNQNPLADQSASLAFLWYLVAGDTVAPQVKTNVNVNRTAGNHFMVAWLHA